MSEQIATQGIVTDLLRCMPDGVVMFNTDKMVSFVNPVASRLTGLPSEGFYLSEFIALFGSKTKVDLDAAIEKILTTGKETHMEEVCLVSFFYELFIAPVVDEQNDVAGGFILLRDITETKELDRAKTNFVSIASHQLRTPLTEIRWTLSTLGREPLSEDQKSLVKNAHDASGHMAETIKAMLSISKIETGEVDYDIADTPLCEVIDDVVRLQEEKRKSKDISLKIVCPSDARIQTDAQLLKEILSNLISNAFKYTPKNGMVSIHVTYDRDGVHIDVADNGCGIPEKDQKNIAQKFFRGSNIIDGEEGGNGIGLNLTYSLMKVLGGSISFASEEGKGTTFTLVFPKTSAQN